MQHLAHMVAADNSFVKLLTTHLSYRYSHPNQECLPSNHSPSQSWGYKMQFSWPNSFHRFKRSFLPLIEVSSIHCWSDAMAVLPSLQRNGKRPDTFVRRRVDEFQKLVGVDYWHHVESKLIGDTAYSEFSLKNLKLKEDVTLLNIMNSKKDIHSKEVDLYFINIEKFSSFDKPL